MKPGLKTSEFIVTILVCIGSIGASLAGILDPKWAMVAAHISTVAYTLSRGLAKGGQVGPAQ